MDGFARLQQLSAMQPEAWQQARSADEKLRDFGDGVDMDMGYGVDSWDMGYMGY